MDSFRSKNLGSAKSCLDKCIKRVKELDDVCTIIENNCEQRSCSSVRKESKMWANERGKMAHAIIELADVIKNLVACAIETLKKEDEKILNYSKENIKMVSNHQ